MQVGRATDIEERLMNAWIFLSGERREFVETVPPVNAAPAHGEAIALLPVEGAEGGVAGCRMVITLELARRVAAHLFGLPAGDLTRADIDDAIRETCNVLGSCIAQGIAPAGSLRIGCPTTGAAGPEEASTLCQFHGLGHFPPHGDRTPRLDLITHAPRPRSTESPE